MIWWRIFMLLIPPVCSNYLTVCWHPQTWTSLHQFQQCWLDKFRPIWACQYQSEQVDTMENCTPLIWRISMLLDPPTCSNYLNYDVCWHPPSTTYIQSHSNKVLLWALFFWNRIGWFRQFRVHVFLYFLILFWIAFSLNSWERQ